MSGASISPGIKTLSVQYFINRAQNVQPTLSNDLTEALKRKCLSQTSLTMVTEGGDVNFEGEITGYDPSKPLAIQGNDKAAQNRLTITVHVKFTNSVEPKNNFDSEFSRYRDYDSQKSPDQVAPELVPQILDDLTEDIFNKAFVNW